MRPRYRVTLTLQERHQLAALTKDGSTNGKRFLYTRGLAALRPRPRMDRIGLSLAWQRRWGSPRESSNDRNNASLKKV
jgi:hypothetical protein